MERIVLALLFLLGARGSAATAPTRTILVFPFENQSGRQDLAWISEAFANILSERLAGPARYVLDRDERDAAYEELGVPPETPLTLASEYKVAESLGVNWAIVGSFKVQVDRLTARARLLDVHRLRLHPPLEVSGALEDLVDVQTRLAWRLLASDDPAFTVGTEEDFARRFPSVPLDAFESYIRGTLAPPDEQRVRLLTESDRLNPADHHAAFELGRYYFAQRDYAESAEWFEKLAPSDAHYHESLFLTGVDDFYLGKDREAEKLFQQLATEVPLSEVWNNLGVLQAKRGRMAEAIASLGRARSIDPMDADSSYNLGLCYDRIRNYDEALKALKEAVKAKPDDADARAALAFAHEKARDLEGERQEQVGLSTEKVHRKSAPRTAALPEFRIKQAYSGKAFRLLSVAVQNSLEARLQSLPATEQAAAHLTRGKELMDQKRMPEAIREFKEAASILPDDSEAHLLLGQAFELAGHHREAQSEFQAALDLDDSAVGHLWLAHAYLAVQNTSAAVEQGEAALRLDPGNRDAQLLIELARKEAEKQRADP